MDFEHIKSYIVNYAVYQQVLTILSSLTLCVIANFIYTRIVPLFSTENRSISKRMFLHSVNLIRRHFFLLLFICMLSISHRLDFVPSDNILLIAFLQAILVLILFDKILRTPVIKPTQRNITKLLTYPIIFLFFIDFLDDVVTILENIKLSIGNVNISLNSIIKSLVFSCTLFWMAKILNAKGKKLIREQHDIDARSKELFSKLYEIVIFVIFIILLLEIIGVDYTALAIFGGALGVGLGFGLQSIASNFISGIILLLDRSLTIGDHIEMEDGQQGVVRELNMRCATVTTYEGKDILIPNERFITSSFVNWTHENNEQRYSLHIEVSYKTDLHKLFDLLRSRLAEHPQVISGDHVPAEKRPDAEISKFCESGVEILIEFWMEGIDDGPNRVGADLLLMIWDTLHENNIEIPYPQREVRIINPS